jgi:hypothetical protein
LTLAATATVLVAGVTKDQKKERKSSLQGENTTSSITAYASSTEVIESTPAAWRIASAPQRVRREEAPRVQCRCTHVPLSDQEVRVYCDDAVKTAARIMEEVILTTTDRTVACTGGGRTYATTADRSNAADCMEMTYATRRSYTARIRRDIRDTAL